MTAKELARELSRREDGDPIHPLYDPKTVIRLVFRLRRKLADAAPVPDGAGEEWGKRLVASTALGYRLTLDPVDADLIVNKTPA